MQETLQGLRAVRIAEQKVQKQPSELTVEVQQVERRPAEKLFVWKLMGVKFWKAYISDSRVRQCHGRVCSCLG